MKQPQLTIYEINTPVFLHEVGQRVGYSVTLEQVPDSEWDDIAKPGIDTVWLMGVWKRSPIAKEMAKDDTSLSEALPDLQDADILGSAYSIQEYAVDDSLGGNQGLAVARQKLRDRGMRLILDFVPNHVAIDHNWTVEHPDYFVAGNEHELEANPKGFIQTAGGIFARGKDPYYDPWSDVLQLNAFSPGLRRQTAETLQSIAGMCDGVRCDMAMLMMNTIFKQTWGERADDEPACEYWPAIIDAVKATNSEFIFLAEVYWDKQQDLLDQGFDLCYDKQLYDRLLKSVPRDIKEHLRKPVSYQEHMLRFLENHDEKRVAQEFPFDKHVAAAVITATLPGSRLYHDGQREGRLVKVPVHLGRRVDEPANQKTIHLYDKLWAFIERRKITQGEWRFVVANLESGEGESDSVLAWEWATDYGKHLVAVNYSPDQVRVTLDADLTKAAGAEGIISGVAAPEHCVQGEVLTLDAWQHVVITMTAYDA